jgi:hypothetical protein
VEEEEGGEEEELNEEQEGPFDQQPTNEETHTELLVDTKVIDRPSIIPVPYPKSTRELRSLSYGSIVPSPKKLSRELSGLHTSIHQ